MSKNKFYNSDLEVRAGEGTQKVFSIKTLMCSKVHLQKSYSKVTSMCYLKLAEKFKLNLKKSQLGMGEDCNLF